MTRHDSGTTRRNVLKATAGLLATGTVAGCIDTSDARQTHSVSDPEPAGDGSIAEHPELPSLERNWNPELEMGLSGARLYTRDGAEAHRLEIARYLGDGRWQYDDVDLRQYAGPNDLHAGEPMAWVRAEDLGEGGTVVFLRAHNERGSVTSPDAERHANLRSFLDD